MSEVYIGYRLGGTPFGSRAPEKIPTLKFWVDEEEFFIDLEELAEALKPFLTKKELNE